MKVFVTIIIFFTYNTLLGRADDWESLIPRVIEVWKLEVQKICSSKVYGQVLKL